jgi:RNA polymerase sigma-70 factor (ECF subfamily)
MTAAIRVSRVSMNDSELISAVAGGNLEALGDLFDRHESGVRRYLSMLGVQATDIDDLVQLTFLEVMRAAPRFDAKLSARAWLLGIANVMVRRHRRSIGRAIARLARFSGRTRKEPPPTPADLVESDETSRRLQHAFDALSSKKREVFVLVTVEGLSGEDAARALGVPVNTVWTRLHHARLELRAAIEEIDT